MDGGLFYSELIVIISVCACVCDQVVSPSCNDELLVKKDQCLVRAFSDSKL